jgi:hypothetical protein
VIVAARFVAPATVLAGPLHHATKTASPAASATVSARPAERQSALSNFKGSEPSAPSSPLPGKLPDPSQILIPQTSLHESRRRKPIQLARALSPRKYNCRSFASASPRREPRGPRRRVFVCGLKGGGFNPGKANFRTSLTGRGRGSRVKMSQINSWALVPEGIEADFP